MKPVSRKLNNWADAFVMFAILFFVIAFIGFVCNSAWVSEIFVTGIYFVILVPVFRGFSILVKNAEDAINKRSMVTFDKKSDEK